MSAPLPDFMDVHEPPTIRVALMPANNAVQSLTLLCKDGNLYGLGSWVGETMAAMTEEEHQAHQLVMFGLHYAVVPMEEWPSFPVYIDHLSRTSPVSLRDKLLMMYEAQPLLPGKDNLIDRYQALASPENYLAFLRQRFDDDHVDEEMELRAFQYVSDPPAMRQLIVDHLWRMWRKYLKPEWTRALPVLQETARAYQSVDFSGMDFAEAVRLVTGREFDEEKWEHLMSRAERLVFVPNPHIGPYVSKWLGKNGTLYFFCSPRQPSGTPYEVPDLSRAEIVMRLSALADDTRMRVLRLIAEQGEMRSQEIMDGLSLSQSAASRHLSQLTATGFLKERRCEGAKCYSLNPDRVQDTLQALASFLLLPERIEI